MAVSRADKQTELDSLAKTFRAVDTAVLIDYKGITVPQVTELRRQIRAVGRQSTRSSRTRSRSARPRARRSSRSTRTSTGPTAVVSTGTDPVAIAKAIQTFNKTSPVLKVKAAVVQGKSVAAAAVDELASLPSKPELYAKLLYVLNAPAQGLVTVLSGVQRGLVTALSAYAEKKEKGE
jgi:large subunit ribosomal protein L10